MSSSALIGNLFHPTLASRFNTHAALAAVTCLLACGGAQAQTTPGVATPAPQTTPSTPTLNTGSESTSPASTSSPSTSSSTGADSLHVSVTPYAWLTSFNGTVGAGGVETDIDQSFSDIFDASESIFGLMGAVDFTYKRLIFQINGAYSAAEFEEDRTRSRSGPRGAQTEFEGSLDLEVESAWFEAMAGYRLHEATFGKDQKNTLIVDAFGGARITSIGIDLRIEPQTTVTLPNGTVLQGGQPSTFDDSRDWVEPFVGLRTGLRLGENWELILRGDVGGFGIADSDFSWQLLAGAGYRWYYEGWSMGLFGGYRALSQDYSDGEFVWDVVTHGPVLGLSFDFSF